MRRLEKILSGFLGIMMLMSGTAKFFDPFKSMYQTQIEKSGFLYPVLLSNIGHISELLSGLALLCFVIYGDQWRAATASKIFYFSSFLVLFILVVAMFVHLHPNVPADVLPFERKPPVLPLFMLCVLSFNVYLYWSLMQKED